MNEEEGEGRRGEGGGGGREEGKAVAGRLGGRGARKKFFDFKLLSKGEEDGDDFGI